MNVHDDFNRSSSDQQNPEVLKKQVEVISRTASYALDKQVGLVGRIFPDAAVKLREQQREAILQEHVDYNMKAFSIFKKRQLKELEFFLDTRIKTVVFEEITRWGELSDSLVKRATATHVDAIREINMIVEEGLNDISALKNEKMRERAEKQMFNTLDHMIDIMEKKLLSFKETILSSGM